MAGVLETAWQPGRSTHGGHAEFKATVYWGPYGGGTRRYWGTVQWGSSGDAWRYWGVPLTPLTTQGECGGIPWPRSQTRGTVPAGM